MNDAVHLERPQKLSIVVFSGAFDKVHYALVMASAAAAIDTPVTLFFTMEGARALQRADGDTPPGWADLPLTDAGAQQSRRGAELNDLFRQRAVADFETLLIACRDLGVRFMVCEMGLKALDIAPESLRDDLEFSVGGVVTFLNDAHRDGAVVFI